MGNFKINQKDILFILKDQLNYGSLCSFDRYNDLDEKTLDMLVNEAITFAKGVVDPLNEIGEREGVRLENGQVVCPKALRRRFGNTVRTVGQLLHAVRNMVGRAFPT